MEIQGIDVSHHQGAIDWEQVVNDNKKFVILKAMYEAQSHRVDEYFNYNYENAGKFGLSRGVYIFIASASINDPQGDANALLGHLQNRPLEYGIWLDFESDVLAKQGVDKIRELAYIYADIFTKAGYYCGIYCNKYWYDTFIHKDLKRDFDFWIARYPKNDTGRYNSESSLKPIQYAVAWQYSSKGNVAGIKTRCDLDIDFDGVINLIAQSRKSNNEIAIEVLEGKWGTANTTPTRKERLEAAGYVYADIQAIVNDYLKKKPVNEVVKEVLEGKWGTAKTTPTREQLLTLCGYDYAEIQKAVNDWIGR